MKLVSWNVNGLRACLNKGFLDFVALADADVICLQETKLQPHQVSFELPGYRMYCNSADKAGYSGTAVLTRKEPLNVTYDFGPYRMRWEDDLREYLCGLDQTKPVVYCGDLNVAHEEIDLKNPKTNHFNPGFSDEERGKMTELLAAGFVDSFRALWPDRADAYSWWSYRAASRARNVGWRIDYFIVSERLRGHIKKAEIWSEIMGGDHCPVMLELE